MNVCRTQRNECSRPSASDSEWYIWVKAAPSTSLDKLIALHWMDARAAAAKRFGVLEEACDAERVPESDWALEAQLRRIRLNATRPVTISGAP